MKVIETFLFGAVFITFAGPACAQTRLYPGQTNTPSALVRIPQSSLPGAGTSGIAPTPSTQTMYPAPIKRNYDPTFVDPTAKNPALRQQ
jgi:hypothetical protein